MCNQHNINHAHAIVISSSPGLLKTHKRLLTANMRMRIYVSKNNGGQTISSVVPFICLMLITFFILAPFATFGQNSIPAPQSNPEPFIRINLPNNPNSAFMAMALNHEGDTLLLGAYDQIGGVSSDGITYVFVRQDDSWVPDNGGILIGSGAIGKANQGCAVAIDADGRTALVGGFADDTGRGAAWIFVRDPTIGSWVQQGPKLVGSGAIGSSRMGFAVALSADGNTAVIGGPQDNFDVGAIWVFIQSSPGTWTQQGAKLVVPVITDALRTGVSVAISAEGNSILVGCPTFFGSSEAQARSFVRSAGTWSLEPDVLTYNGLATPGSPGGLVALSADGRTAVVGDLFQKRFATFVRETTTWTMLGFIESFTALSTLGLSAIGDKLICGLESQLDDVVLRTLERDVHGQQGFVKDRITAASTIFKSELIDSLTQTLSFAPNAYALSGDGKVTAMAFYGRPPGSPAVEGIVSVFSTGIPPQKPNFYSEMLIAVIGSFFAFMVPTIFVLWCVRPIIELITKVRKPTPIIYGSEVKKLKHLRAYLNRNGDPDAIPPYQRPYLYLLVPIKVQILAYMFITWVVLFICLMTVYANSNTCVAGRDSSDVPVYVCNHPSGGQQATYLVPVSEDGTFADHINVMPLAAITMGFAVPFWAPGLSILLWLTICAIGRGPRNRIGTIGGGRMKLLHFAAIHKNVKAVEALIQHGADLHSRDASGRTPLDFAKSVGAPMEIIKLLTEDGVSIEETDVFFSHAWGRDGSTHKVVVRIAEFLQSKGIRVWIDKERLKGDIVRQMTGGIDKTKIVLVFVSQDYIEKVGGPVETDNCKLEFQYAARKKMDAGGVIPVLLDPKLKSTADWTGPVGFYLGKSLYVDMTLLSSSLTDTGFNAEGQKKLEEFEARIRTMLQSYVKNNPSPMASRNPGFLQRMLQISPHDGQDLEAIPLASEVPIANEVTAGHFGQVAPSRPAPNSEQEIRAWADEVGLGDVLAQSIIRAGFTDRISLKALFDLTPKDLKATLELPDLVAATKLKSALGKLSYD